MNPITPIIFLIFITAGFCHTLTFTSFPTEKYDGVWEQPSMLSQPRSDHVAIHFNDEIWLLGGSPQNGNSDNTSTVLNTVSIFDPNADTWRSGPSMLTPRYRFAAAVCGSYLVVCGGRDAQDNALSSAEYYDPADDMWHMLPDNPISRSDHASFAFGTKFFVIGGYTQIYDILNNVSVYDFATMQWSAAPSMIYARGDHVAAVINDKAYVLGGFTSDWSLSLAMECFDSVTQTWSLRASLNHGRSDVGISALNGTYIFITGGEIVDANFTSITIRDTEIYNVETDTWHDSDPMPGKGRMRIAGAFYQEKAFVFGGHSVELVAQNEVYSFHLSLSSASSIAFALLALLM